MPLIWKGTDHFKNRGDYRRFAVFCILRVGTEIYDTVLANTVDRSMTDISFDDAIIFHDVPPDFELRMEVYSCLLQNDLSIASTPRKLKKRISSSLSRTLGRKAAAGLSGERFDLVARASLKLADSSPEPHAHDLLLENLENAHHQLPLFGYFCCRLAVRPHCLEGQRLTGPLLLVEVG
ncbi:RTKN2 [Cordylochernes scorpioides]|uniref:RTKN2 n=1 Tax=Cordylochernes scorpioides TaxID=51811 RepID=A0ABY6KI38_9ARAC|nr:RTKN2 [Cordylochernes scorpioides]